MQERIRVLAVDDEPDLRHLLGIHLRAKGYDVVEAADGFQAVQMVREDRSIDLVIMDIMMEHMIFQKTFIMISIVLEQQMVMQ